MSIRAVALIVFCSAILAIFISPVKSFGNNDNISFLPSVNHLLRSSDYVEIDPKRIGGPESKLIYRGGIYNSPVVVPKNSIVGIIADGHPRLYHPAMGEDIVFSDQSDKLAFACFWLSLQPNDLNAATSIKNHNLSSFPKIAAKSITSGNSLPDGMTVGLPPMVSISRNGPNITFTNRLQRWAAVKVHVATITKVYFLAPYGRQLTSNVVLTLADQGLISGEEFEKAKSPNSVTISSSDVTRIDVFGALFRSYSIINQRGIWPPGTNESWEGYRSDRELVLRLNLIDTFHFILEGTEHLLGLVPIECFDTATSFITNQIEHLFLKSTTTEERVSAPYAQALSNEFFSGLVLCCGEVAAPPLALLNTFFDFAAALDFTVESYLFALPEMALTHSFWVIDDVPQPAGTCDVGSQTIDQKGRTWQRCAPFEIPAATHGSNGRAYVFSLGFTHSSAKLYCENLTLAGLSDWRLPTKSELKDLVYCSNGKTTPLADDTSCTWWDGPLGNESVLFDKPTWFPASPRTPGPTPNLPVYIPNYTDFTGYMDRYWTSTQHGDSEAWTVDFESGFAGLWPKDYAEKHEGGGTGYHPGLHGFVRCVR